MFLGIVETSIAGLHRRCVSTLIGERNKNCHINFLFSILFKKANNAFFFIQQLLRKILQYFIFQKVKNSVLDGRFELCNKQCRVFKTSSKNQLLGPREKGTTVTTSNTDSAQLLLTLLRSLLTQKVDHCPSHKDRRTCLFHFDILLCLS